MNNAARLDVYICGVGGQGIGLLSEALLRAADFSGQAVKGVDTHGLAQRGGMVSSHLRVGPGASSPLVRMRRAGLVVALERHEAVRAVLAFGAPGSVLVYYDAVWQPLPVRLGKEEEAPEASPAEACARAGARAVKVFLEDLPDARMQNVAVLGALAREALVPGVSPDHYRKALRLLVKGPALESNLSLFDRILG